jgi:hypothetical protein
VNLAQERTLHKACFKPICFVICLQFGLPICVDLTFGAKTQEEVCLTRTGSRGPEPGPEALPLPQINAPALAWVSLLLRFVPPQAPVLVVAMPGSALPFLLAPGHPERRLPCPGCLLRTGSPLLVKDASLKVETLQQFGDGVLPIQAGLRSSFVLSPLKFPNFGTLSRLLPQAAHFLLHHGMATIHLRQPLKMASTGHF